MSIGNLYIVSAPSGAGKTSLVSAVIQRVGNLLISISHTTRPKRSKEQEGVDYHFVEQSAFKEMVNEGEFLEHAEVFGNYYGTSKSWVLEQLKIGKDVILEIDWQGAQQVKQKFAEVERIFILPPSLEALHNRLTSRGQDDEATIKRRISQAQAEISHYKDYDYLVVNDDFEQALAELQSIFVANRSAIRTASLRYESLLEDLLS